MLSEDEALARRLQSEEFSASQGRPVSNRRVDYVTPRPPLNSSTSQSGNRVALQMGSSMTVKLHHVLTNRQIGEVVTAHYLEANMMAFELATSQGKFLRAKSNGTLDYSSGLDDACKFRVEALAGGNVVYLLCKQFEEIVSRQGGRGWYLALSPRGELHCNGGKGEYAQWSLVSAGEGPANPPPAPASTPASEVFSPLSPVPLSTPALVANPIPPTPPIPARSYNPTESVESGFPGFDAGREELMRYFHSPGGQAFLSQGGYEAARELFRQGKLSPLLHRPDWPVRARQPRLVTEVGYDEALGERVASFERVKKFFEEGYTLLPQVVPLSLIAQAQKVVNFWLHRYLNQRPGFNALLKRKHGGVDCVGDIGGDEDLLALYYSTALPHFLQRLFGQGEVAPVRSARVALSFPCLDMGAVNPALLGDQWGVEGFTSSDHSPYSLLVGVPLCDFSVTDMGNFCVHPGSHLALLERYREEAERRGRLFSSDPDEVQKPDLGEPLQLCLKAGDAFLCTQRLAHLHALNTSSQVSSVVFFQVSHVDHAVLKDPALQSIWVEYKHASDYLDREGVQNAVPVEDVRFEGLVSKPETAPSLL